METNPYVPPNQSSVPMEEGLVIYSDAGNGKRFLNYILDIVALYIVIIIMGVVLAIYLAVTEHEDPDGLLAVLEGPMGNLIGIMLFFLYYAFWEGLFGLTPGKLATGTRVRDSNTHGKPGLGRIMLRTLCRFIPFEPFSFFSKEAGGWHDRLSKTRTVDIRSEPMTAEMYEDMRSLQ